MNENFLAVYRGKKVLITGHTGFKGSWLCQWLSMLQADVLGYALESPFEPSLHDALHSEGKWRSQRGDVRDFESLKRCVEEFEPEIIFHLAAQSLVRESYLNPIDTWESNVNGTVNLLESVRQSGIETNIVVITSDKCYDNKEWIFGYRENDPLGGHDPYSASKGAAEIVVSSWRNSYFQPSKLEAHKVKLASGRAGNVIGGGDWSNNRIVPDCMRALQNDKPIVVRNPLATRPWQHVLESLGGYLLLGTALMSNRADVADFCSAFNFGPYTTSNKTVEKLVVEILGHWKGSWEFESDKAFHEAYLLNLNIDKAMQMLGWRPNWAFEKTIEETVRWYKSTFEHPAHIAEVTERQIADYSKSFNEKIRVE